MTRTVASPEPPAEICASEALAFTKFSDEIGANAGDPGGPAEASLLAVPLREHADRARIKTTAVPKNWFLRNIEVSSSAGGRLHFADQLPRHPHAPRAAH